MNYPLQKQPQPHLNPRNIILIILALIFIIVMARVVRAEETLTASWYSYESCRKEGTNGVYTASGERFNENDYTAAMWGIPFGTLVKVTNITNGLSVTVRINDRGPAKRLVKKGRIIDLSRKAFKQIADLKQGIIKVKIEEL